MATWIVHLRMADYFLEKYNFPYAYEFAAGNLGADCGYGKKDSFGEFTPPPQVTHWTPTGSKRDCEYKKFYKKYLEDKKKTKAFFFYLGYYTHLLTDIMWSKMICIPTYEKYADEYKKDPEFLRVIKLDWNDRDFQYMENHPDFEPYKIIENGGGLADYMPYYEKNQLNTQINGIVNYYKTKVTERDINRKYEYLTDGDFDDFILNAPQVIETDFVRKGIL